MSKKAPVVREYMTHLPVEVESCETLGDAVKIMEAKKIRHFPVMHGAHLFGLVSQRDILHARLASTDAEHLLLKDICQRDVLTVGPLCPVNEVAQLMMERKVGSAIVEDCGYVVGLFTTFDALRVLSDIFA